MDQETELQIPTGGAGTSGIPLYVLSGGSGSLGQQLIRTVLAQFAGAQNPVHVFSKILTRSRLETVLEQARLDEALVIHTFVDGQLREATRRYCQQTGLAAFDVVGPVLEQLSGLLSQQPIGKPGLYRDLHKSYFDRIDAINFTLQHDDGKDPEGWPNAEIILLGVSRVGKTPLSLYLSMLGWKVANIPFMVNVQISKQLFAVNQGRIVGLKIDPGELIRHRAHRIREMGLGAYKQTEYTDPARVFAEYEAAKKFMRQNGYPSIDTTDKPIETTAGEVTRIIHRKLRDRVKISEE